MTAAAILVLVACGSDAGDDATSVDGGATVDAAPSPDAAVDASPWTWWGGEMGGRWQVDRVTCHSGGCQPSWLGAVAAIDVDVTDAAIAIDWLDVAGVSLRREIGARYLVNCILAPDGDYMGRPVAEHALCISAPGDTVARVSVLVGRTDGGPDDDWTAFLER